MNENKFTPNQPPFNHSVYKQTDNVFVLIQVVNELSDNVKSNDIGSTLFVSHMLTELRYLSDQTNKIRSSINSFLRMHPNHPQALNLEYMISQVISQIDDTKQTFGQLSLSAFKDQSFTTQHQNSLNTLLHTLYLTLSRLQNKLRSLEGA